MAAMLREAATSVTRGVARAVIAARGETVAGAVRNVNMSKRLRACAVNPRETLATALARLEARSLLVVTVRDGLAGVITEKDCVKFLRAPRPEIGEVDVELLKARHRRGAPVGAAPPLSGCDVLRRCAADKLRSATVAEAMTPAVQAATVAPDAPILEALELMRDRGLASLPVVDADGALHGLVRLTDLVPEPLAAGEEPRAEDFGGRHRTKWTAGRL
mmetsp:Transcript_18440/g.56762  ORF Transcript_18440/g.56762 Transcript_18440/m.56762 type:complete len:218 (+) Transcript_18440:193-846(+)